MGKKQGIYVMWVEQKNQPSDFLTKAGASSNKLADVLEKSSLSALKLLSLKEKEFN